MNALLVARRKGVEVAVGGEEVVGVGVREEVERVLADAEERKEGGGGSWPPLVTLPLEGVNGAKGIRGWAGGWRRGTADRKLFLLCFYRLEEQQGEEREEVAIKNVVQGRRPGGGLPWALFLLVLTFLAPSRFLSFYVYRLFAFTSPRVASSSISASSSSRVSCRVGVHNFTCHSFVLTVSFSFSLLDVSCIFFHGRRLPFRPRLAGESWDFNEFSGTRIKIALDLILSVFASLVVERGWSYGWSL